METISMMLWLTLPKEDYKKSLKIPKGNQNPDIEEEQTTQWPKEKVQRKRYEQVISL